MILIIFSDPWWIYTTCNLFWVIKTQYNVGIFELVRQSPRFAIMLGSMCISIAFMMADILSVTGVFRGGALPIGINPFWKVRKDLNGLDPISPASLDNISSWQRKTAF